VPWPGEDLAIPVIALVFLASALIAVRVARRPAMERIVR
jgi:hypothetical protein